MHPTSPFFGRILNVPPDADKETITAAYRKRALKYHPDRAGDGSNLKFQHVGAAYETLMSTSGSKGNLCGLDKYAGMNEEDVEWMMNLRRQQRDYSRQGFENSHSEQTSSKPEANANQQEEEDRSVKFSFESDSPSTTDDNGLFKECPVCSGPLYRARVLLFQVYSIRPMRHGQLQSQFHLLLRSHRNNGPNGQDRHDGKPGRCGRRVHVLPALKHQCLWNLCRSGPQCRL
jgi:curved DNA-binding protein CbpA